MSHKPLRTTTRENKKEGGPPGFVWLLNYKRPCPHHDSSHTSSGASFPGWSWQEHKMSWLYLGWQTIYGFTVGGVSVWVHLVESEEKSWNLERRCRVHLGLGKPFNNSYLILLTVFSLEIKFKSMIINWLCAGEYIDKNIFYCVLVNVLKFKN
jgi:hypothetical protein